MLAALPNHQIMVTGGGPFGRAWFDCPQCSITRVFASKRAANQAALAHYIESGGVIPDGET